MTLSVAKRYDYLADTTTRQLVHDALERNQARRDAAAGLEAAPPTADAAGAAAGAAGQPAALGSTQQDPPPTPAAAARRLTSDAMAAVQRSAHLLPSCPPAACAFSACFWQLESHAMCMSGVRIVPVQVLP